MAKKAARKQTRAPLAAVSRGTRGMTRDKGEESWKARRGREGEECVFLRCTPTASCLEKHGAFFRSLLCFVLLPLFPSSFTRQQSFEAYYPASTSGTEMQHGNERRMRSHLMHQIPTTWRRRAIMVELRRLAVAFLSCLFFTHLFPPFITPPYHKYAHRE